MAFDISGFLTTAEQFVACVETKGLDYATKASAALRQLADGIDSAATAVAAGTANLKLGTPAHCQKCSELHDRLEDCCDDTPGKSKHPHMKTLGDGTILSELMQIFLVIFAALKTPTAPPAA